MRSTLGATRRFATDPRFDAHLTYLQAALVLALGDGAPSYSTIVRRAVALLAEQHVSTMIEAGRLDGLPGPHAQDAAAERDAVRSYSRLSDATAPTRHVDGLGRQLTFCEATQS
jgi:hypothetical protein